MKSKVVLNWIPPAREDLPSLGLSILKKSILNEAKFDCDIVYWNRIFNSKLKQYYTNSIKEIELEILKTLPFLYWLAKNNNDIIIVNRITTFLSGFQPKFNFLQSNFYLNELETISVQIVGEIEKKLKLYNNILLWGFSAKFNQWIASILFSKVLKDIFSNCKIVVGGFSNKKSAFELMKNQSVFDYAIWGAGEVPLNKLCNSLNELKDNFEDVPRLIYREQNRILISREKTNTKLDRLKAYSYPSFQDFYQRDGKLKNDLIYPLELRRTCSWNKCKFCVLNRGYKRLNRSFGNLCEEIKYAIREYKVKKFMFCDNDIVGSKIYEFDQLLNELILLNSKNKHRLIFYGEISHSNLSPVIIMKMKEAGFEMVQIGFESLNNYLLKEMRKKNNFSDNISFLKYAYKFNLTCSGLNIIMNLPEESESVLRKSIENIRFLRFYLGKDSFKLKPIRLRVSFGSIYYNELSNKKENLLRDEFSYFISTKTISNESYDFLFDYYYVSKYQEYWKILEKYLSVMHNCNFKYNLIKSGNNIIYREYLDEIKIKEIKLDYPICFEILNYIDEKCNSFYSLFKIVNNKFFIKSKDLKRMLINLREESLIYFDENYNNIISIIDISKLKESKANCK